MKFLFVLVQLEAANKLEAKFSLLIERHLMLFCFVLITTNIKKLKLNQLPYEQNEPRVIVRHTSRSATTSNISLG